MTESAAKDTASAADDTAIENAYRAIDRYVFETSQPALSDAPLLSPSQRLRALGRQQARPSNIKPAAVEIETPLSTNDF
jgi:hypothetical protein